MGGAAMRPEAARFARVVLGLEESTALDIRSLGKRGSDRSFFRLVWPPRESVIVIDYDPKRQENCYHAPIAKFLEDIGVPVPHIVGHDPSVHVVVTEDLGDADLWSFRNAERRKKRRAKKQGKTKDGENRRR